MKSSKNIYYSDRYFDKRISFIIATKNRFSYLKKTLHNINNLKKKNDEIILVDGSSYGDKKNVVEEYKKIINKYIFEDDISEGHAFNKGILISKGKYIKIVTDDDLLCPDAIEQSVNILDKHKDIDLLLCGGTKIVNGTEHVVYHPAGINYGKKISDIFRYGGCGIGLIFRHRVLSKIGLFNSKALSLDLDFLAQAISRGAIVKFCRLHMYIHPVYIHSAQISRNKELNDDMNRIKSLYGVVFPKIINEKKENIVVRKFRYYLEIIKDLIINKNFKNGVESFPNKYNIKKYRDPIYNWDGGFS
jgi:glycosyltransferase involved in cell wall biosynthesis